MIIDIADDWLPTVENRERLPEPLRRYIHDLQTVCDPAGLVRENFILRRQNEWLRRECERLAGR